MDLKLIIIIGGGIMLIMAGAIAFAVSQQTETKTATQELRAGANAEVNWLRDTGSRHNHNPVVEISLRVEPDDGLPFEARVRTAISPVRLPSLQPGARVDVRYDPDAPGRVELAREP